MRNCELSNWICNNPELVALKKEIDEIKRILFLKGSENVGLGSCYDYVDTLINYTFSYAPEPAGSLCAIPPSITYYNVNINNSFNGDRIWNFVFGGFTQNAKYTAVFQFDPNCYVPNGVDKYQLKDLNFYQANSTTLYEPFQGYIVVNGIPIGVSGGSVGPVGTPLNTNNNIITPNWVPETATFTMNIDLNNAYVGWFQQIQPPPPFTPGGGQLSQLNWQPCGSPQQNSVFFNIWIRDAGSVGLSGNAKGIGTSVTR